MEWRAFAVKGSRNRADVQRSTPRECCMAWGWSRLGAARFALQRRPAGPWLQRHGFAIPGLRARQKTQKILNRRINSWRASIARSGFILLSIFSRRPRSIAASSRTSWLRAFHFAYLAEAIPRASSADRIQTVMSVVVTRSIRIENP